jgi:hypothetical protein
MKFFWRRRELRALEVGMIVDGDGRGRSAVIEGWK